MRSDGARLLRALQASGRPLADTETETDEIWPSCLARIEDRL